MDVSLARLFLSLGMLNHEETVERAGSYSQIHFRGLEALRVKRVVVKENL